MAGYQGIRLCPTITRPSEQTASRASAVSIVMEDIQAAFARWCLIPWPCSKNHTSVVYIIFQCIGYQEVVEWGQPGFSCFSRYSWSYCFSFSCMFKRNNHLHCFVAWCFVILLQFALPNIQSLAFFLASASCFFKVWTVGWPYKARACDWPRAAAIHPHAAELVLVARVLQVKLADHSSCIQDHARWALFEVQMYRRRCHRREGGNKTASPSQLQPASLPSS